MNSSIRLVLLTARALVIGAVTTLLFQFLVAIPLVAAAHAWGSRQWLAHWLLSSVLPGVMPALGAGLAGWAVAWFNPDRRVRMVVSYAVFVVILTLPRLYALVASAATDARFLTYLLNYALNIVVVAGGVLVGGLWIASPQGVSPRRSIL